jgi:peptide/nickel transport system permease protein
VIDAWLALPGLVIAVLLVSLFGQSMLNIIVVLGLSGGIQQSRVVRSAVLEIKHRPYLEAARSMGADDIRLMLRHILPNIMPILIVLATTALGGFVLAEAGLSFLGYGVPPPQPTWGGMLTGSAVQNMVANPWIVFWPGAVLAATVYSANMFGDALRDILDPRLRGSR